MVYYGVVLHLYYPHGKWVRETLPCILEEWLFVLINDINMQMVIAGVISTVDGTTIKRRKEPDLQKSIQ